MSSDLHALQLLDAMKYLVEEVEARAVVAAMKRLNMDPTDNAKLKEFFDVVKPVLGGGQAHVAESLGEFLSKEENCVAEHLLHWHTIAVVSDDSEEARTYIERGLRE